MLDRPHHSLNSDGTRYERTLRLPRRTRFLIFESDSQTSTEPRNVQVPGLYRLRLSAYAHQSTGHPVVGATALGHQLRSRTGSSPRWISPPTSPRVAESTVRMNERRDLLHQRRRAATSTAPTARSSTTSARRNSPAPASAVQWIEVEGRCSSRGRRPGMRRVFGDVPIKPIAKPSDATVLRSRLRQPDRGRRPRRHGVRPPGLPPARVRAGRRPLRPARRAGAGRRRPRSRTPSAGRARRSSPRPSSSSSRKTRADSTTTRWPPASRISSGSTLPDDELLQLAAAGKLDDSAHAPAARPNACWPARGRGRSSKNFCGQWLNLRAIDATNPDQTPLPRVRPAAEGRDGRRDRIVLRRDAASRTWASPR